ncbi:putative entry exclusion protein TrbK-alt [Bradyrhizobium huanghuaihaiense]|uniref:putative entry exclusion protein TrbK-alt n=1 Tax=Bradyrhizobium huanghuaihaiense TaxID=990078 RepID=UPI0021AA6B0D|nr:putative entry exclusion protein TrbK-alt [Bradyrhizobium sp. CB3035]UWU76166.1 putative entry exclusion protein TrbK-alt [Bradyrhizobium sp. CB3035]
MTDVKAFRALSLLTTIGLVAVAACTIQLRGGDDSPPAPKAEQTTSDLARCRVVAPEETASYRHCQQVWSENRRRFFGKKNGPADAGQSDSTTGLAPAPKDQSRIPQGYPPLAIPDTSKS